MFNCQRKMFNLLIYLVILFYSCLITCMENNEEKFINDEPYYITWDWREKGMVSPVKNQGNCSAFWAFSAVACIESHLKIYENRREILSEQFLIDCDGSNVGCGSTTVTNAYGRIVSYLGGVLLSSEYTPYASKQESCSWNAVKKPIPVLGYQKVKSDEDIMRVFVQKIGPLSAAINSASMKKYTGGIDDPTEKLCPAHGTDHAVLIVGFSAQIDKETGVHHPFWIIKNSWGKEWGQNGYYYLVSGRNACGIATDVSFPYVN